ncbi:MAG: response regulator [Candidatus Marinimicrobia bacterium]|jgi:CheY-like chemotaxis protein|nr:response regulator [Candidatus Scalindua sp.]MBT6304124.1 response regulator [Candidatus Neomarinimicrobiota bacterium]
MAYKILLVDDEKRACDYFGKTILKKTGEDYDYNVSKVYSGLSTVDMIALEKFDVVLLDIIMPGIDGLETLRRIRIIDKHVIVVMLTSVANELLAKVCLTKGANDYLTKPVNIDYLMSVALPVYCTLRGKEYFADNYNEIEAKS